MMHKNSFVYHRTISNYLYFITDSIVCHAETKFQEETKMKTRSTVYSNIDINSVCRSFLAHAAEQIPFREDVLYPMVDQYENTCVSDIMWNIFCQYSATESQWWTTYREKYLQREANGEPVDFREEFQGIYRLNQEHGVDPYEVWFRRCKEVGIRPWISVRMNDCHAGESLKSSFFEVAKKEGWLLGDAYGYYGTCFDYRAEEVRRRMLGYVEEQLGRYDVYGLELDFMREIFCFPYLDADMKQCAAVMNDFIRRVKAVVTEAEKQWAHPIRIAIRVNRDMDQALAFGFDVRTWAAEGLVDVLVPSARWSSADSSIPLEAWKEALSGVEISGCLESVIRTSAEGLAELNAEMARGHAANFLAAGADSIYLYNYYEGEDLSVRDPEVWRTCGDFETIFRNRVRCVVLNQEQSMCPPGFVRWCPLPMQLSAGVQHQLQIRTGPIPAGKQVKLIVGMDCGLEELPRIAVNGVICSNFMPSEIYIVPHSVEKGTSFYECRLEVPTVTYQQINLQGGEKAVELRWIEILIED